MPTLVDFFNNNQFSAVSLSRSIQIVPNAYGRLNELGLFRDEPIPTTTVAVQFENGILNLLPTRERGAPPSYGMPEKRNLRAFVVPHIPHEDFVLASELQNVIAGAGGSDLINPNALEYVQNVVNRKLLRMRAKHAITLEHLRAGAIKGIVLDNDGSTIFNWFTEFGVTEKVIDFPFTNAATDVPGLIVSLSRWMEDNLLGDVMDEVRVLCSPEWFDAFVAHASIKDAYKYFASDPNPNRDDVRGGFRFKNVVFEEYRGVATQMNEDKTTTARKFIPTNEARAVPLGTQETFVNYWAPADFIEAINTMGEQVYAKQAVDLEFQRWVKIHTQSNPLPVCTRPALLVRLTKS
jgi:hypothetical protein